MITQEHLEHWLKEMEWQLNGLRKELARSDGIVTGIKLSEDKYFSFEYAKEKEQKLEHLIKMIRDDIAND